MDTCNALDDKGRRCRATKDLATLHYFGDNELYPELDDKPTNPCWVEVKLCPRHRKPKTRVRVKS